MALNAWEAIGHWLILAKVLKTFDLDLFRATRSAHPIIDELTELVAIVGLMGATCCAARNVFLHTFCITTLTTCAEFQSARAIRLTTWRTCTVMTFVLFNAPTSTLRIRAPFLIWMAIALFSASWLRSTWPFARLVPTMIRVGRGHRARRVLVYARCRTLGIKRPAMLLPTGARLLPPTRARLVRAARSCWSWRADRASLLAWAWVRRR